MTRRNSIVGLAVAIAFFATTACVSEDRPSVHLVVAYQLRGVTGGVKDQRDIDNLDGLGGFEIACELGKKKQDIFFSADFDDGKRRITLESKAKGKSGEPECSLTVREDNIYQRECEIQKTDVDCSEDTFESPCRVSITERENDMVEGLICCDAIPIKNKQPQQGDFSFVAPGSSDEPASFAVYHCEN